MFVSFAACHCKYRCLLADALLSDSDWHPPETEKNSIVQFADTVALSCLPTLAASFPFRIIRAENIMVTPRGC